MMNVNFKKIISDNYILVAILFLASFLRFYNYSNRWALAYDQAWFAVIARHALATFQIPLLGPFASGGPFQTGGEWFWIVMAGTLLNPFSVISPWIFITLLSVFQIFLLYILGKNFGGKGYGYILSLLGAVSTSQTLQATNLTSQMTASICATLMLIFMLRFFKNKKDYNLFWVGFFTGLSSAIQLQGILLLIPFFVFLFVARITNVRRIVIIFLGVIIPWVPVLMVDVQNNFYNTKNMLLYFNQNQSQISYEVLGRRWLTFAFNFIPMSWGRIAGGNIVIGYLEIISSVGLIFWLFVKKKLSRELVTVILSTILATVALRYIKTPLYENYLTFIHPFVFLIIALVLDRLYKNFKVLALVVFSVIVIGSIVSTFIEVSYSTNETAKASDKYVHLLKQKFPGKKFAIYDYKYKQTNKSLPLVLYMQTEGLLDDNGTKIGVAMATSGALTKFLPHSIIYSDLGEYHFFNLSASSSAVLDENGWALVNPSVIYNSVENWWKD